MINTQYINLNMIPSGVMPVLYVSQYDIGRPLGMVVYNGGEAVDLDSYTCTIEATRTDGTAITAAVTTDDNIGAFVTTATMTNQADKYPVKLVLFDSQSRRVASLAFMLCVTPKTMDENAESIQEDESLYQQFTGTVQALIAEIREDISDLDADVTDLKGSVQTIDAKKIWSIQTNVGSQDFYGLFASLDGLGHKMVDGYSDFLPDTPSDVGTEWYPFRHGDYYGFAITYSQTNYDLYVAITKDFVNWVHAPSLIGFRSASSYPNAYVWTPQIFEYNGKTYVAATVQEGAVIGNGSRYDTAARQSAIYITEVEIDYETATVTKVSSVSFTRVAFGTITDKAGETHNISGYAMDAWFAPTEDKLYCVFNDRYMLQLHAAVADDIDDTFTICGQNIFLTTDIEAPTVFQIDDNLWKVCGCVWNTPFFGEEMNICCYTSDFIHFKNYQVMKRIDQANPDGTLYTRRMRNPAFFYMDAALEHEFCRTHVVKTLGYDHIFKTHQSDLNYAVYNMLTYTDIALPPNTEMLVKSTGISFPELSLGDIYNGDSQLRIINKEGAVRTITYAGTAYDLADGDGLMIDYKGKTVSRFGSVPTKTGTDVITKNSEIAALDVSNVNASKLNGLINLTLEVGQCPIKNGITILGTLSSEYRPSTMQSLAGYIGHTGADSAADIPVRVVIYRSGVVHVIGTVDGVTPDTLRCSATYISR